MSDDKIMISMKWHKGGDMEYSVSLSEYCKLQDKIESLEAQLRDTRENFWHVFTCLKNKISLSEKELKDYENWFLKKFQEKKDE